MAYVGTGSPFRPQFEHPHANALLKIDVDRSSPGFGTIIGTYKGDTFDRVVPGYSSLPCTDIPVLLSTCHAERVEGGYRLTGRKQFGSNGPVWSWLGAHAMVADAPGGPQVVHAFVHRDSPGVTVVETWDTLGMRPTQSHDTILDGVFVPECRKDPRFARQVAAGPEAFVGVTRDPDYGPILAVGPGGSSVERLGAGATALAPVDLETARELVADGGVEDAEDAVARALVAVGRLAAEHPEIAEVDVNPLVLSSGGAVAVDALVVLG